MIIQNWLNLECFIEIKMKDKKFEMKLGNLGADKFLELVTEKGLDSPKKLNYLEELN